MTHTDVIDTAVYVVRGLWPYGVPRSLQQSFDLFDSAGHARRGLRVAIAFQITNS